MTNPDQLTSSDLHYLQRQGISQFSRQGWQKAGQYEYWPGQWLKPVLISHYWSIGGRLGRLNHWSICLCPVAKLVLKASAAPSPPPPPPPPPPPTPLPPYIMYMRFDYIFISEQDKIVFINTCNSNYLRSFFLFDHKSKDIIAGQLKRLIGLTHWTIDRSVLFNQTIFIIILYRLDQLIIFGFTGIWWIYRGF